MSSRPLVLRGGRLVDLDDGHSRPADVIVADGRIVACGSAPREIDADGLDLGGAFVLPGLVDAHAHVAGWFEPTGPGTPPRKHLAAYLDAGVTTIRDAGAPGTAAIALAEVTQAPVIQPAGQPIRRTRSVAEGVRTARIVARSGAAWLKAYDLPAAGLAGVLAVGRETGLCVGVHLGDDPAASIGLGVEAIEHVYTVMRHDLVDDRARRSPAIADADRSVATWALATPFSGAEGDWYEQVGHERPFLTPTLSVMRGLLGRGAVGQDGIGPDEAPWLTESERLQWRRTLEGWGWWAPGPGSSQEFRSRAFENLGRAVRALAEAGCRICVGTDFSQPLIGPGVGVKDEMLALRDAGLSALDVLRAATLAPAALLRMEGEIGVVAVGARADLMIVGRDPLADLETLGEPILVVADGRVVLDRRSEAARAR